MTEEIKWKWLDYTVELDGDTIYIDNGRLYDEVESIVFSVKDIDGLIKILKEIKDIKEKKKLTPEAMKYIHDKIHCGCNMGVSITRQFLKELEENKDV